MIALLYVVAAVALSDTISHTLYHGISIHAYSVSFIRSEVYTIV